MNFLVPSLYNKEIDERCDITQIADRVYIIGPIKNLVGSKESHINNANIIYEVLTEKCGNDFLVFSFGLNQVDKAILHNKLVEFNYQKPSISLMFNVVYAMEFWLSLPNTSVVLLAQASTYLTEMFAAAYYLRTNEQVHDIEAIQQILIKRNFPSQQYESLGLFNLRSLTDFQTITRISSDAVVSAELHIDKIEITNLQNDKGEYLGEDLQLDIFENEMIVHSSRWPSSRTEYDADEMKVIFHCNCIVKGDIYLHCYRPTKDNEKEKEMFFESWFNTAAFPDVDCFQLMMNYLQVKPLTLKHIGVYIYRIKNEMDLDLIDHRIREYYPPGAKARAIGMNVLSEHLVTEADVPYCKYLASFSYNHSLITLCWKLSNNVLHKTIDLLKSFKVDESSDNIPSYSLLKNPSSVSTVTERSRFSISPISVNTSQIGSINDDSIAGSSNDTISDGDTISSNSYMTESACKHENNMIGIIYMCEICKKNTIEDADQLITCTSCDKKYHSYCIDGKRIPFDTLTEKNRAEHDKYVATVYGDFVCSLCKEQKEKVGYSVFRRQKEKQRERRNNKFPPLQRRNTIASVDMIDRDIENVKPLTLSFSESKDSKVGNLSTVSSQNSKLLNDKKDHINDANNTSNNDIYNDSLAYSIEDSLLNDDFPQKNNNHVDLRIVDFYKHSCVPNQKEYLLKLQDKNDVFKTVSSLYKDKVEESKETDKDQLNEEESELVVIPNEIWKACLNEYQKIMNQEIIEGKQQINQDIIEEHTETPSSTKVKLCEHPKYKDYFKKLKVGVPIEAVKGLMTRNGLDPSIMDHDPNEMVDNEEESTSSDSNASNNLLAAIQARGQQNQSSTSTSTSTKVKLCEHPKYKDYFKKLKIGVPIEAVKGLMTRNGLDPSIMDHDPVELVDNTEESEEKVPLANHPVFGKYFSDLAKGVSKDQIMNQMTLDGYDPQIINRNPQSLYTTNVKSTKKTVKRYSVRKKVRWQQISPSVSIEKTIWNDFSINEKPTFISNNDLSHEFEHIFVDDIAPVKEKTSTKEESAQQQQQQKRISFIDPKRSTVVGVSISKLKSSFFQVRQAIQLLKPSLANLTITMLESIQVALPQEGELESIKNYGGDPELLSQPDRFQYEMIKLPRVKNRVDILIFKMQLEEKIDSIRKRCNLISNTSIQLKTSTLFKDILHVMLQLGNYLNAQTDDGFDLKRCIRGFSLTSLQIIRNVKGNDKRTTLLDFLVTILEEFNNNAFDVLQELGSIEDATKVQFDVIEQDCKSLEKQFMIANNEFKACEQELTKESMNPHDVSGKQISLFNEKVKANDSLKEFVSLAKEEIKLLKCDIESCKDTYSRMLTYFGETEIPKADEYFTNIHMFILSLISIHTKHMEKKSKESKTANAKPKEKKEEKKKSTKPPEVVKGTEVNPSMTHHRRASLSHISLATLNNTPDVFAQDKLFGERVVLKPINNEAPSQKEQTQKEVEHTHIDTQMSPIPEKLSEDISMKNQNHQPSNTHVDLTQSVEQVINLSDNDSDACSVITHHSQITEEDLITPRTEKNEVPQHIIESNIHKAEESTRPTLSVPSALRHISIEKPVENKPKENSLFSQVKLNPVSQSATTASTNTKQINSSVPPAEISKQPITKSPTTDVSVDLNEPPSETVSIPEKTVEPEENTSEVPKSSPSEKQQEEITTTKKKPRFSLLGLFKSKSNNNKEETEKVTQKELVADDSTTTPTPSKEDTENDNQKNPQPSTSSSTTTQLSSNEKDKETHSTQVEKTECSTETIKQTEAKIPPHAQASTVTEIKSPPKTEEPKETSSSLSLSSNIFTQKQSSAPIIKPISATIPVVKEEKKHVVEQAKPTPQYVHLTRSNSNQSLVSHVSTVSSTSSSSSSTIMSIQNNLNNSGYISQSQSENEKHKKFIMNQYNKLLPASESYASSSSTVGKGSASEQQKDSTKGAEPEIQSSKKPTTTESETRRSSLLSQNKFLQTNKKETQPPTVKNTPSVSASNEKNSTSEIKIPSYSVSTSDIDLPDEASSLSPGTSSIVSDAFESRSVSSYPSVLSGRQKYTSPSLSVGSANFLQRKEEILAKLSPYKYTRSVSSYSSSENSISTGQDRSTGGLHEKNLSSGSGKQSLSSHVSKYSGSSISSIKKSSSVSEFGKLQQLSSQSPSASSVGKGSTKNNENLNQSPPVTSDDGSERYSPHHSSSPSSLTDSTSQTRRKTTYMPRSPIPLQYTTYKPYIPKKITIDDSKMTSEPVVSSSIQNHEHSRLSTSGASPIHEQTSTDSSSQRGSLTSKSRIIDMFNKRSEDINSSSTIRREPLPSTTAPSLTKSYSLSQSINQNASQANSKEPILSKDKSYSSSALLTEKYTERSAYSTKYTYGTQQKSTIPGVDSYMNPNVIDAPYLKTTTKMLDPSIPVSTRLNKNNKENKNNSNSGSHLFQKPIYSVSQSSSKTTTTEKPYTTGSSIQKSSTGNSNTMGRLSENRFLSQNANTTTEKTSSSITGLNGNKFLSQNTNTPTKMSTSSSTVVNQTQISRLPTQNKPKSEPEPVKSSGMTGLNGNKFLSKNQSSGGVTGLSGNKFLSQNSFAASETAASSSGPLKSWNSKSTVSAAAFNSSKEEKPVSGNGPSKVVSVSTLKSASSIHSIGNATTPKPLTLSSTNSLNKSNSISTMTKSSSSNQLTKPSSLGLQKTAMPPASKVSTSSSVSMNKPLSSPSVSSPIVKPSEVRRSSLPSSTSVVSGPIKKADSVNSINSLSSNSFLNQNQSRPSTLSSSGSNQSIGGSLSNRSPIESSGKPSELKSNLFLSKNNSQSQSSSSLPYRSPIVSSSVSTISSVQPSNSSSKGASSTSSGVVKPSSLKNNSSFPTNSTAPTFLKPSSMKQK